MALPAVVALVGKLAASSAVQSAATKVAGDVYERVMSRKPSLEGEKLSLESLAERVDQIATREELIASFSALQAELDLRHKRTSVLIAVLLAAQVIILVAVLVR